jgi:hypothetical protein
MAHGEEGEREREGEGGKDVCWRCVGIANHLLAMLGIMLGVVPSAERPMMPRYKDRLFLAVCRQKLDVEAVSCTGG